MPCPGWVSRWALGSKTWPRETEREEEENEKNIQERIRLLRKRSGKRRKLNEKNDYNESRVVQIESIAKEIREKRKSCGSEPTNDNPENVTPNPKRVIKFQQDIRMFARPQEEIPLPPKPKPDAPLEREFKMGDPVQQIDEQRTTTHKLKQGPPLAQADERLAACLQPKHGQPTALQDGKPTETHKLHLALAQADERLAAFLQQEHNQRIPLHNPPDPWREMKKTK